MIPKCLINGALAHQGQVNMNVENGNGSKSNRRDVRCDTLEWSREPFRLLVCGDYLRIGCGH
jgi:hypothetical protein